MLSESASVLSPLVSDSDIDAFLSTPRGCDFIYGKWKLKYMLLNLISVVLRYVFSFVEIIEIYGICRRIRLVASINSK